MPTCIMIATRVSVVTSVRASWHVGDHMHNNDASHKAASDTCERYCEVQCMRTTSAHAEIAKAEPRRARDGGALGSGEARVESVSNQRTEGGAESSGPISGGFSETWFVGSA